MSAIEFLKSVYDTAGAEITLFCLAFFLHFVLFSERRGILRRHQVPKPKKKLISTSALKPDAKPAADDALGRTMLSFLNEVPKLQPLLKFTGKESAAEVQEMLTSAGIDAEVAVIQAAVEKKHPEVLRRVFAAYASPSPNQAALLRRLVRKGCMSLALECLKTHPQKASLYAVAVEVAADRKDLGATLQAFEAAVAAKAADTNCYNAAVRIYGTLGQMEESKKMMQQMLDAGLAPDVGTFHGLLEGTMRSSGDTDKCFQVIHDMTEYNLKPTNMTCAILLKSIQKNSSTQHVERVVALMDDRDDSNVDDVLLGSLCEALTRSGHTAMLVQRLKKLRLSSSGVPQVKCAHTVGSIIRAYGAQHDMEGVWDTWSSMQKMQFQPTRITIGCMVEALAWNSDPEGAYKIIQQTLKKPETRDLVNAVMYCSVIKAFNHQNKFSRVWLLYGEMIQDGIQPSVTIYNALLDVCARTSELHRIQPMLTEMANRGLQPSIITYGTIIKAYCSSNRLDDAFQMMEAMKRGNITADEITYNTILDGCARYGMFDRGVEVLSSMKLNGVKPSNYTLSVVTKLANRSKRPHMAFELVDALSKEFDLHPNMHVYNNLIQAATLQGYMSKAQGVFASMLNAGVQPDSRTWTLLLRSFVSKRLSAEVMDLIRAAFGLETEGQCSLEKELAAALQGRQISKAAWKKGGPIPDEDALSDAFEHLSRLPTRNSSQVVQAWRLLKEVQAAMPNLKVKVEIRTRLAAMLGKD
eukprot:CAMPEP_0197662238 /NCGR_PEP_ID=MMETSP1338-20131121/52577_1 /TAXON_ID=43686 ORGANISM="Pelagodinium beii, Strain RCC1491" /NCGR_SAMPLE_ID=MMETSP1338 /ASSEMBLY_ACC=CAM_ASM_000754 /LENGTH=750 /DNA_ID=CAMNT_0043239985 /DNA_START=161 /DNA_END=2413 /DNA_ORIENTATION=+